MQKKYLEALKKYEEVILLKRDTYGDRSETVSAKTSLDGEQKNILYGWMEALTYLGCPLSIAS